MSTQEAKILAGVAKRRGMTRGDMCRNILIEALTGSKDTMQDLEVLKEYQKKLEDAQNALDVSQKDREFLQEQVKDFQGAPVMEAPDTQAIPCKTRGAGEGFSRGPG